MRMRLPLIAVLTAALAGGGIALSRKKAEASPADKPYVPRDKNPANLRAIDSVTHRLHSGQLLLRTGADATSYMLRMMNFTDKTYSHCGIVMIEDGYPFVYHSIGGEDNPDERLRRDSALRFLSPVGNERLGLVQLDLKPAQVEKLHAVVKDYYRRAPKFDMDFDLATDDRLYCAELVYKAVRKATGDTAYFHTTHVLKRTFVGIDNLYHSPHAHLICDYSYK